MPALVWLLVAAGPSAANSSTFEDVFGPCGDSDIVEGPQKVTIDGVTYSTPGSTLNIGKDVGPFDSDSFHIRTFGPGVTLTFPSPISHLRFDTGVVTPQAVFPTFHLSANGSTVVTFGADTGPLGLIDIAFAIPVDQVRITFGGGSSSVLGIDNLCFDLALPMTCSEFEDVFGPCGDSDNVAGPQNVTIDGVMYSTPDFTFNKGKNLGPFDSDYLDIWTYGPGATLTFPSPISHLRFNVGVGTPQAVFPTFHLSANGSTVVTFGADTGPLGLIDIAFATPVDQVQIKFNGGSSSLLGIDDLCFSTCLQASSMSYGAGFPGTNGVPTLVASDPPVLGSPISLEVGNASGVSALAEMFVGLEAVSIQGGWGGTLLVQPALSIPITLPAAGLTIPFVVPADTQLCGVSIFVQVLENDAGAAQGISNTPGLELVLGF